MINLKIHIKTRFRAFTLLEASLALLLIGILSSLIIPYYQLINKQQIEAITAMKANYVRKAIEAYVARHGFLPCAGDDNGLETDETVGFVPYKTLGIHKSYSIDGYGRFFIYAVNESLTVRFFKRYNKKILPIQIPQNVRPSVGEYHFCRIYRFCEHNHLWPFYYRRIVPFTDQSEPYPTSYNGFAFGFFPITNAGVYDHYEDALYIENSNIKLKHTHIYCYLNNYLDAAYYFDKKKGTVLKEDLSNLDECIEEYPWLTASVLIKDEAPYRDCIAWILISGKPNGNQALYHKKQGKMVRFSFSANAIFWQSRFNLAAQTGHPCTTMSMNIQYGKPYLRFKKAKNGGMLAKQKIPVKNIQDFEFVILPQSDEVIKI